MVNNSSILIQNINLISFSNYKISRGKGSIAPIAILNIKQCIFYNH